MAGSEPIDLTEPTRQHRAWLVLAGWLAVAAVMALILRTQARLPLPNALAGAFMYFSVLGVLVWLACQADARFGLWRQTPPKAIGVHAAVGVTALTIWAATQVSLMRLFVGRNFWRLVYDDTWMFQLLIAGTTYAAGVGLGLTFQRFERERLRRQREAALEVVAREAELQAIKAQLQPHFLLNSLNSVLALIRHDPFAAEQMLGRLASLLHGVFDRLDQQFVPLAPELDMLRDYLEVERMRFDDRLRFDIRLDADAGAVLVPPLLLQPLVENAVKHGIEPHTRPGTITIDARLANGRLQIAIVDTGEGLDSATSVGTGRGIELTRRRLDSVYGNGAELRMERLSSGFRVSLDLPARVDVV
jgi:Histidine kinase/Histidine kinase-, DNA gyrase B-, and HSP90-like ATPase